MQQTKRFIYCFKTVEHKTATFPGASDRLGQQQYLEAAWRVQARQEMTQHGNTCVMVLAQVVPAGVWDWVWH